MPVFEVFRCSLYGCRTISKPTALFQPLERTFFSPRSATLLLLQVCRLLARGRPSNWGIMLDSGGLGVRTIEILLDKRVLFKLTPLKKPKSLFNVLYTPETLPLKQSPSPQTALNLSSSRLLSQEPIVRTTQVCVGPVRG